MRLVSDRAIAKLHISHPANPPLVKHVSPNVWFQFAIDFQGPASDRFLIDSIVKGGDRWIDSRFSAMEIQCLYRNRRVSLFNVKSQLIVAFRQLPRRKAYGLFLAQSAAIFFGIQE